ncbi:inositol monophosphatase family protein [Dietzia sp.]|uniref:inositol monophosphatase family protein n=1 Tax=Dietzia sp. TaxID=1871616 RepID=UPI002FDA7F18
MTEHMMPTDLPVDPEKAMSVAAAALDAAWDPFVAGLGAKASRFKESPTDFATEVDLSLERQITDALQSGTGLEVHGEEFGGPPVNDGTLWVLDPVDGTANYSLGIPDVAIMAALIHKGQPVVALTWLPLLGMRFSSMAGKPLEVDGRAIEPVADSSIRNVAVGLGSMNSGNRGTYTSAFRREVVEQLSVRAARTRKFGSTGVDLAYVSSSRLSAAVTFGHYAWDNAPGACHVRAAGGIVTDLAGDDWNIESQSLLAASPRAHGEILDLIRELGDPATVTEAGRRWENRLPDPERQWLEEGR